MFANENIFKVTKMKNTKSLAIFGRLSVNHYDNQILPVLHIAKHKHYHASKLPNSAKDGT